MKSGHLFLLLGICGAGLATGFAARRISGHHSSSAEASAAGGSAGSSQSRSAPGSGPDRRSFGGQSVPKLPHSGSIESLLALSPDEAYPRIAAWLTTASEEEIQSFWEALSKTDDPATNRQNVVNLTFLNWARLNPQGAIAAVKGSPYEHFAWWAWSACDPAGAFAAASASAGQMRNVAQALGEFHPQWLREHYNDLPEEARNSAFAGLEKWGDAGHPEEMLKFLSGLGRFDNKTFLAWVQQDPLAAYDWLISPKGSVTRDFRFQYRSDAAQLATIVDTLSDTDPDALQRLIDRAPTGLQKRRLEGLTFNKLLDSDPEAAMQQAQETKSPRVAAERLAAVGAKLIQTDPDQALSLMHQILSAYPSAISDMTWVEYPNGGMGTQEKIPGLDAITGALMEKSPEKLMTMAAEFKTGQSYRGSAFASLANSWAQSDLEGYGNWVNEQTDPGTTKAAVGVMVQQLANRRSFQEAAQWAQSVDPQDATVMIQNLMYRWGSSAPDDARAWLQSSNLPQADQDRMLKMVTDMQNQKER